MGEYIPESQSGGVWIGCVSEAERLKRLNRLQGELEQLNERWNNRLTLKNRPLWEEYRRGRLSVVGYLHFGARYNHVDVPALVNHSGHVIKPVLVLIFCADTGDALNRNDRDQELMLVEVVQVGQFPNLEIPSFVRAYLVEDERCEFGRGFLYRSELRGGYKNLPFLVHRERDPVVVLPDEVCGDVVQAGPEIVDGVANTQREADWHRCDRGDFQSIVPGLRVYLHDDFAEVRLEKALKNRVDLVDVAVGPMDL